jgi:hypothetical protein
VSFYSDVPEFPPSVSLLLATNGAGTTLTEIGMLTTAKVSNEAELVMAGRTKDTLSLAGVNAINASVRWKLEPVWSAPSEVFY